MDLCLSCNLSKSTSQFSKSLKPFTFKYCKSCWCNYRNQSASCCVYKSVVNGNTNLSLHPLIQHTSTKYYRIGFKRNRSKQLIYSQPILKMSDISLLPSPPTSPPTQSSECKSLVSGFSLFSLDGTAQSNKQSIHKLIDDQEMRITNIMKENSASIRDAVDNLYTVSLQAANHSAENDRLLTVTDRLNAESKSLKDQVTELNQENNKLKEEVIKLQNKVKVRDARIDELNQYMKCLQNISAQKPLE